MILGINASRARSGGARAHLIGVLSTVDPLAHGFEQVHVWAPEELCAALPARDWLVCHAPEALKRPMPMQVWWERFELPKAFAAARCDLLFNVDGGSVARVRPSVTMSQDMLSYEPNELRRYPLWRPLRTRIWALGHVQNAAFRWADGVIFLTRYAGQVIQDRCGALANVAYIPHGVSERFRQAGAKRNAELHDPVRCIYVSPVWAFKHQWNVVEAVAMLRQRGRNVMLTLVGGGDAIDVNRLEDKIASIEGADRFVERIGHLAPGQLPEKIASSDIYIFASSCENLPITLLEGMSVGLPIACSRRGPMPEVLVDGGLYFDPLEPASIADAVDGLLADSELRSRLAERGRELAAQYSWSRCADDTFRFLREVALGAQEVRG